MIRLSEPSSPSQLSLLRANPTLVVESFDSFPAPTEPSRPEPTPAPVLDRNSAPYIFTRSIAESTPSSSPIPTTSTVSADAPTDSSTYDTKYHTSSPSALESSFPTNAPSIRETFQPTAFPTNLYIFTFSPIPTATPYSSTFAPSTSTQLETQQPSLWPSDTLQPSQLQTSIQPAISDSSASYLNALRNSFKLITTSKSSAFTETSTLYSTEEKTSSPTASGFEYIPETTFSPTSLPTWNVTSSPQPTSAADVSLLGDEELDLGFINLSDDELLWKNQTGTLYSDATMQSLTYNDIVYTTQTTGKISSNTSELQSVKSLTGSVTVLARNYTTGTVLWVKDLNSGGNDTVYSFSISYESLAVVGSTIGNWFGAYTGGDDMFVVLLDPYTGDITSTLVSGYGGIDSAFSIISLNISTLENEEAIVGGSIDGAAFVGRFSLTGTQSWSVEASEVAATIVVYVDEAEEAVTALQTAALPQILLTETDNTTYILKKFNLSTGSLIWSSDFEEGVATSLAVDNNSTMLVAGYIGENILVRAYDSYSTESLWEYTSREGWANSVALTSLGGYPVVVGSSPSEDRSDYDAFVLTLDIETGEELCFYTFGSTTADDEVTSVAAGKDYEIILTGYTSGSLFSENAGEADAITIALDQSTVCSFAGSTAPDFFQSEAVGQTMETAVTTAVAVSAGSAVATVIMAPSMISASSTFQISSGLSASGTITYAVINQMQFITTTNMIASTKSRQFIAFTENLNWINLWWSADVLVSGNQCIANDSNGVGGSIFVGNTVLVFGITFFIYIVHVLVVSLVEGYWLAKDNARHHYHRTVHNEELGRLGRAPERSDSSKNGADDDDDIADDSSAPDPIISLRRSDEKRIFDESKDEPMVHVLRRSSSFWLHFPHIELLFLLFAYEGAVAAQVSALGSNCWILIVISSILLLLYPLFLFFLTWRIVQALNLGAAVFIESHIPGNVMRSIRDRISHFFRILSYSIRDTWKTGRSLFAYADTGYWEIPRNITSDRDKLGRQSFMMAYEPVFKNLNAKGIHYALVILFRLLLTSIIAVAVKDAVVASFSLLMFYFLNFLLVLYWRPFSNKFMWFAESSALAINSVCLLLMWIGSTYGKNPTETDIVFGLYLLLQCVNIFILVVPIYIDSIIVLVGRINNKRQKSLIKKRKKLPRVGLPIRKRDILRYWRIMIGYNLVAMISSLKEGDKVLKERSVERKYSFLNSEWLASARERVSSFRASSRVLQNSAATPSSKDQLHSKESPFPAGQSVQID